MRVCWSFLLFFSPFTTASAATVENRLQELESQVSEMQLLLERLVLKTPPRRPIPEAPRPSPPLARSYQIRAGDSYWSIARRHGIEVEDLERANPGVNPRRLSIGRTIQISGPAFGPSATRRASGSYEVRKGDILGRIAKRHGVSLQELMAANPQVNPRRLRIGSALTIPDQSLASVPVARVIPPVETKSGLPETPTSLSKRSQAPEPPAPNLYQKALKPTPPVEETIEPKPLVSEPVLITLDEDTRFSQIANNHQTTVTMLNELNKRELSPDQMIKAGSQLYIPSR